MKTKTKIAYFLPLCLIATLFSATSVNAMDTYPEHNIIKPYYENFSGIYPTISIGANGLLKGVVSIQVKNSESFTLTLNLQQQKNGRWITLDSKQSTHSSNTVISDTVYVVSGYNYRVQATVEFADETETATSSIVYY